MSFPLRGKVAVVTGAGRGIGAAIATALSREGAGVALIGRDAARLERQAAELSADALVAPADITDPESVHKAFAKIRERFPRIDILVNNAGQAESAPFSRTDVELWNRMLAVNLTGTYLCTREVLPAMLKQDYGRVINVASTAGLVGYAYVSAYCAAKHGVIGLTRSLALELAPRGITVNALCPGWVETAMAEQGIANGARAMGVSEAEFRRQAEAAVPLKRFIDPREVGALAVYVASDDAAGMTGQALNLCGGATMD